MPILANSPRYRTGQQMQPMGVGATAFGPGQPGTSPLVTGQKGVSVKPVGQYQRPNGSYGIAGQVNPYGMKRGGNGMTDRGPDNIPGPPLNKPMQEAVASPTAAVPATDPPVATPPPAPSGLANPYQVTAQGQAGLSNMGIPLPAAYTPRDPMTPIPANTTGATGTSAATATQNALGDPSPHYGDYYNYQDFHNATTNAMNRYTGGVTSVSNPVTPGSAVNGGIGGPGQVAALNSWQLAQNEAQLRQAFGDRGPQFALRDVDTSPQYIGGSLAAQNAATGQARDAQGRPVWQDANGRISYTAPGGAAGNPSQAAPVAASSANPATASVVAPAASATPAAGSTAPAATAAPATAGTATAMAGAAGNQNALLNQLAGAYDSQQIAATNANEQRYRDILSGYGSAFDRQNELLTGAGQVQSDKLNRQFDSLQSKNLQDSVSRGLAGTTILPSMRRGTENSRAQAQNELADQIRQQRLGVDQQNSNATLGFMERRSDNSPSMSELIGLAQALGNAGDGSQAAQVQPLPNYYGLGGGGGFQGIDYVSNGMDGGAYGQQAGSYTTNAQRQQLNAANQQTQAMYLQMMRAMQNGGQQQQAPQSYMDRQRAAINASGQQQRVDNAWNQILGGGNNRVAPQQSGQTYLNNGANSTRVSQANAQDPVMQAYLQAFGGYSNY